MTPDSHSPETPSGQSKARALREALRTRDNRAVRSLLGAASPSCADPVALLRASSAWLEHDWLRHLHADFCALAGPDDACLRKLAAVWRGLGIWSAAEATLRQLLVRTPSDLPALRDLAAIFLVCSRGAEAESLLQPALGLHPRDAELWLLHAQLRVLRGEIEPALAAFQLAEEHAGRSSSLAATAGLQFVLALAYLPDVTATDLREAAADWESRHAPPAPRVARASAPASVISQSSRRLRVGYYSPDLRRHSITHFFLPLLRNHDRKRFEIFVYSDSDIRDSTTDLLRSHAEHWLELRALDEPAAARRIAADRLDLLVDLSGLFGSVRPRILAARPAPIQAHLLGYNGSTGLSSLDYRFSDPLCDPPGSEAESSETVVRLEPGFHCFDPLIAPIPEGPSPCEAAGHVTFGSFNILAKIGPEVVALWSRVLLASPGSRLLIKAIQLHDASLRETVVARFAEQGVAPDRIDVLPGSAIPAAHIELYRRMDIALDPFPCNGTTTTCEALWMGVPVITLPGARHAARVTSSLLAQVGLAEFIATDADDYVRRAVALAADRARLAELRSTLRTRFNASPLGDAPAYARRVETAYDRLIAGK